MKTRKQEVAMTEKSSRWRETKRGGWSLHKFLGAASQTHRSEL
jgi:hypothetical protein